MEPITLCVLLVSAIVFGAGVAVGNRAIHNILISSRAALLAKYSKYFPWQRITVLGPAAAGKSSLIAYLRTGQPYDSVERNGQICRQPPCPTSALVVHPDPDVILERFSNSLQGAKIPCDVGGDPQLQMDQWPSLLGEVDPHGIIYVVEGNVNDDVIAGQVEQLGAAVLTHYAAGSRSLKALFVFLNKMDLWRKSIEDKMMLEEKWTSILNGFVKKRIPELQSVKLSVVGVQLNKDRDVWPEAHIGITQFAGAVSDI